jgi:hypothetical protein
MSQYRNGIITSTGAAVTLPLGFVPDHFIVYNWTAMATDATAVIESHFFRNVTPDGYAFRQSKTITTGAVTTANITSNGFTPVILGGDWQSTQYTITTISNANPGVVKVSGISPTNTLTLVNGMTVTISGVRGMTQVNTNRYIVGNLTIDGGGPAYTFSLYDLFGNPVDTTAFGTYSSGGIVNQISYPPTAPVLNATTGAVITPGQPAGNQYDIGYMGIILGTGVVGSSTNTLFWEAFYSTPTGW